MRFGLNMNNKINCEFWVDLKDEECVPLVNKNTVFLRLQKF